MRRGPRRARTPTVAIDEFIADFEAEVAEGRRQAHQEPRAALGGSASWLLLLSWGRDRRLSGYYPLRGRSVAAALPRPKRGDLLTGQVHVQHPGGSDTTLAAWGTAAWTLANDMPPSISANSSGTIGRAKLDGTGVNQSFISGADHPCGVAVDDAHVYWANEGLCGPSACGGTTIGRANLDGSAPNESFITGLSAPVDVAVNGSYIYWGNNDANTIGRANLDGTSPNNTFINGIGGCTDLPAIDAAHIYWANDCASSIGRANLDGTSINETFISVPSNPGGVAVDSLPLSSPVVTGNPVSRTVTAGQPASFTASATGTPTPTVQWQASINGVSFQNIPGAAQTTFTIAAASTSQSGDQFRAVFTNSAGSVTTAAAKLTVLPTAGPPNCTLAPQSARVFASTLARAANKPNKKPPKSALTLTARCNQAAHLTLSGKISAVLVAKGSSPNPGKGKRPKTKAFQIGPLRASITAGKSLTLTVKLPDAALAALKAGARESAAFTLTATNTNGSSQATAKIRQLKLVQVRRK
jgi:hypothetical protein